VSRSYPSLRVFRAAYISPQFGACWNGDECCICLEKYDNRTHRPVGVTSNSECEHVFGWRCLEAYLDSANPSRNTCPVCRRKWYNRSTSPPAPRNTNTSHVLSPPMPHGTAVRVGVDLGSLHRRPPRLSTLVDQAVEQLFHRMEDLEASERRETIRLEQDARVCLQQVQSRIHAFLGRHVTGPDISSGPVRRQARTVAYSTVEGSMRQHEESAVGQHPYPLFSAALQGSTVSLPEFRFSTPRHPQRADTSDAITPPTRDYRRDFAAVTRRPRQFDDTTILSTEPTPHRYESNMALPQPSPQVRQEVHRGLRNHLRRYRYDRSESSRTQAPGWRNISHDPLSNITEVEGSTPPSTSSGTFATQTTDTGCSQQHARPPVQQHAQILFPRHDTSLLHGARSTREFAHDTQPVDMPTQPLQAASMAEREEGLRRRATTTSPPRGLSRIVSLSNIRNMVAGNRTR
jgi:hypothetical protein